MPAGVGVLSTHQAAPSPASVPLPPAWLHGLFAVIPTPMDEQGALDLASLDRVVEHYLDGGAAGLVPASIAGEGHLLSEPERRQVIARVVQRAAGRAPVLVGVLTDHSDLALLQAREAAALGASGLLVKPPRGLAAPALQAHLGQIADSLRLPMVLIDHPAFGAPLPLPLVLALVAAIPEIVGLKVEDEPTPAKMQALRALLGERVRLFGGLGGVHVLEELEHGSDGLFTGLPQAGQLHQVIGRFRAGDLAGAQQACAAMRPAALWEQHHPAEMVAQRKRVLQAMGVCAHATVRLARAGTSAA